MWVCDGPSSPGRRDAASKRPGVKAAEEESDSGFHGGRNANGRPSGRPLAFCAATSCVREKVLLLFQNLTRTPALYFEQLR
jgi:hypothetical protein